MESKSEEVRPMTVEERRAALEREGEPTRKLGETDAELNVRRNDFWRRMQAASGFNSGVDVPYPSGPFSANRLSVEAEEARSQGRGPHSRDSYWTDFSG